MLAVLLLSESRSFDLGQRLVALSIDLGLEGLLFSIAARSSLLVGVGLGDVRLNPFMLTLLELETLIIIT